MKRKATKNVLFAILALIVLTSFEVSAMNIDGEYNQSLGICKVRVNSVTFQSFSCSNDRVECSNLNTGPNKCFYKSGKQLKESYSINKGKIKYYRDNLHGNFETDNYNKSRDDQRGRVPASTMGSFSISF